MNEEIPIELIGIIIGIITGTSIGIALYILYRMIIRKIWGKTAICAKSSRWKITEAYDPIKDYAYFVVKVRIIKFWIPIFYPNSICDARDWAKKLNMNDVGGGPGSCH